VHGTNYACMTHGPAHINYINTGMRNPIKNLLLSQLIAISFSKFDAGADGWEVSRKQASGTSIHVYTSWPARLLGSRTEWRHA